MLRDLLIDQELVAVEPDARVVEVSKLMAEKNVGTVLVLTDGKPRGILTDRDIVVRCLAKNVDPEDCTIENIMTESLETCSINDGLFSCIQKMRNSKIRRIPVVDDEGNAVGVISFGDIVALLGKELHDLTRATTVAQDEQEDLAA